MGGGLMTLIKQPLVNDDGTSDPREWGAVCPRCGKLSLFRYVGDSDVDCITPNCGASFNCWGQQLRDDWRGNSSNYDDDISDMEGFEMQHAGDDW
jgi:hypothetical protein